MIDTDFLHLLDQFSLIVRKRVTSNYKGERQSKVVGSGLVFRDYARYSPGDDYRAIDWKLYGKTRRLYVKRYEEDRNLTVHIVLDFSASMKYGTVLKSDYASMIGLGFSYMALKNNENFVLATFSNDLDVFKPRKGKQQIVAILDYLNKKKPQGTSELSKSLLAYQTYVRHRSLFVVISDFLYDIEQIKTILNKYRDHRVLCIQVLDHSELHLDLEGDFTLVDLENKSSLQTFVDPLVRQKYLEALAKHSTLIRQECDRVGAEFYQVDTSKPIFDTFFDILS